MRQRMNRLWRMLAFFLLAKKRVWHWPRQSDVLIFDAVGEEILTQYLHPWATETLHVRGEQISMPVLISSFFRRGRKTDAYLDCFIERVRPRLAVTFIDNNPGFYQLAARHPGLKTLSIQNGVKSFYFDIFEVWEQKRLTEGCGAVTHLATFGSRIGMEYSRYIQCDVVPIGSLKNNHFLKKQTKAPGTIAFISQFRETKGLSLGGRFFSHEEYFQQPDRLVLGFLVAYAKKSGKKLLIVPCSDAKKDPHLKQERDYYQRLLGEDVHFSEVCGLGSSYGSVDSAEVVVSIDSALAYESAARGNKTAIFPIRSQLLSITGLTYGWPEEYPDEGPYWSNRPDPVVFEQILDHLFDLTDEQWQAELSACGFNQVMAYDPGNSVLQGVLHKELGSAPVAVR
jgi:surface carbohydrate biosynthesis protein